MTKRDSQLLRRWLVLTKSRGPTRRLALGSQAWLAPEPLEQRQMLNVAPIADAGGPYVIAQNATLHLDASLSSDADPGDTLTYAWDLDQDGQFDNANYETTIVSWNKLVGLGLSTGTHSISVRVTDSLGASNSATTTLTVSDQLSLLRDINGARFTSNPRDLTVFGDRLVFSGTSTMGGKALISSSFDGVDDLTIESAGENLRLAVVGETLYFTTNDGTHGYELFKYVSGSDPVLVKDIRDTTTDGAGPTDFVNVNGTLFFRANNGVNGYELWKSNGTSSGTVMVKNIMAGAGNSNPSYLTNVGGTLYFKANDGVNGVELWKSNGTSSGTVLVKDIRPGTAGPGPVELVDVGGTLYFRGNDGASGYELWKSDGTNSGTVLVKDIRAGASGSLPAKLTNVGGVLYFVAKESTAGNELWKSDGTSSGTVLVKNIRPGGADANPTNLLNLGGLLYFSVNDGASGYELWKSDGTSSGTVLVKDISPGAGSSLPSNLTNLEGVLYFSANDGVHGEELWKSDGTASGTVLVEDLRPGPDGSSLSWLTNAEGVLFFNANNGVNGSQLWLSDDSANGRVMVRDLALGREPLKLFSIDGTLYFSGLDRDTGYELWKSDGTSSGTVMVKDGMPGSASSNPAYMTNVSGMLYFVANNGTGSNALWKSDGTSSGTVKVYDQATTFIRYLANVGGTLYFASNDGVHGIELWKSDGTSSGTVMVKDIAPGFGSSVPRQFADVNGIAYFRAGNSANGLELWKSDGTSSGTVMVKDIVPGPGGNDPNHHFNFGGTLVFVVNDGVHGVELWKSDGTDSGTEMVKDIRPGNLPGLANNAVEFVQIGGTLYFAATDGVKGSTLWKSDGTSSGTVMVKDIRPGTPVGSGPTRLTNVGGTLYFLANDGVNGYELWKSNGTSSGTVMVKDIAPGAAGSTPLHLHNVGGTLYFTVSEGFDAFPYIGARSLWKSDGTSSGTVQVADASSVMLTDSAKVAAGGGRFYFDGYVLGEEKFHVFDTTVHPPVADAGGPYAIDEGDGLTLSGSGTHLDGLTGPPIFSWDVNGDGIFGDATGANPTLTWAELVALGIDNGDASYDVQLRISDANGPVAVSSAVAFTVENAAPTAAITGLEVVTLGASNSYLLSATDPSPADQAATFTYRIDWDGDGIVDEELTGPSSLNVSHTFAGLGLTEVRVTVSDRDDAASDTVSLMVQSVVRSTAITGPQDVSLNQSSSFLLTVTDPSADPDAEFTYLIDWDGDGDVDEELTGPASLNASHAFDRPGPTQIHITALDPADLVVGTAFLPISVAGASLVPSVESPGLSDLLWGGTSGADEVIFEQVDETTIRVRETRLNGVIVDNEQVFTNVTGRVIALGDGGDDILRAAALSMTQATLDGGADTNQLYGGQAGDILIGGANGAEGKQGDNVIIAGNGNNTIYGNAVIGAEGSTGGNNLIVGGSGSDTIYGSYMSVTKKDGTTSNGAEGGQNLIIGGAGSDEIYASQQTDGAEGGLGSIVIAGTTNSLDQPALVSILNEWTSTRDYATRLANISGTGAGPRDNGDAFLQAGVTVQDDAVSDELFSDTDGNANWFLYALATDVPQRVKPTDTSTYLD